MQLIDSLFGLSLKVSNNDLPFCFLSLLLSSDHKALRVLGPGLYSYVWPSRHLGSSNLLPGPDR